MKRRFIAALLACAAVGGARVVIAQQAGCAPAGGLEFICGLQGPEDLVLVPGTRWLIASGLAEGSGLQIVDTEAKTARRLFPAPAQAPRQDRSRYARCPAPLDGAHAELHGLSLRAGPNGRHTLYATNHGGRESIEVFEVDARGAMPSATWIGCVLMPDEHAANSVAAFSDGTIVATVLVLPGRSMTDSFAGRNTGAVFMWTPGSQRFRMLPGTELPSNNGIETSPDDREFFVASSGSKRIVAFSRENPGKPLRAAQLKEFAPDNVRWIEGNRLITAGMIDDEPACGGAPKTPEGIRCPRGYIVATIDPKTMAVTEIARGPRNPVFSGAAIAMPVGNELWLGSFSADRLAYRTLPR